MTREKRAAIAFDSILRWVERHEERCGDVVLIATDVVPYVIRLDCEGCDDKVEFRVPLEGE